MIFYAGAQAQGSSEYKTENYFDLAIGASKGNFSSALSWSHLYGIGKNQRFKIGYGARFTNYIGANKYFSTAPAKYTSTKQGITTIFSKTLEANLDTITTTTASINTLNLALFFQYRLLKKFDIGFNIDVIGLSFGPKKPFNILSSDFDDGQEPVQSASPTRFNLLLTSDNDIGSLNSEFYVKHALTQRWSIRAGLAFIFAEFRTQQDLSFDNGRIVNDRYRYKAPLGVLAVAFQPFAKL
ncbi:MAG: hypothetical protein ABI477_22740 [Chryseolinea sp.]